MLKLKATIDRFEDKKAVLVLEDSQTLIVNKDDLEDGIKEGEVVYITISKDENKTADQQKLAKNILQEILKKPSNET